MNKWKNYGLWTSIFSLFGLLVRVKYPNYMGDFTSGITYVLSILSLLGIISNPKDGKWYSDKKIQ